MTMVLPRRLKVGVGATMISGAGCALALVVSMTGTEQLLTFAFLPGALLMGARPRRAYGSAFLLVAAAWAAVWCVCAVVIADSQSQVNPLVVFVLLLTAAGGSTVASVVIEGTRHRH